MIYVWYYFTVFLFSWYTAKLLKNALVEQYWHIPQMIFLIAVYALPFFWSYDYHYLIVLGICGIQFPFLFNSMINAYRGLPIEHLGKADFLKFWQTVLLFALGVCLMVLQLTYGSKI